MSLDIALKKLENILLVFFLVLVFALPRVFQTQKIVIMLLLLFFFIIRGTVKLKIHYYMVYLLFFIPSLIVALYYNNELKYIIDAFKIYFFFPVLITFILSSFTDVTLERLLYKSAFITICITTFIAYSSFLNSLGIFPVNINSLFYDTESYVGVHTGYYHIVNTPLSYLTYLVPLYFFDRFKFNLKSFDFYLFILVLVISVISSRRIILLPFIIIFLVNIKKMKYVLVLGLVFLLWAVYTNKIDVAFFQAFYDRMNDAINNRGDSQVRDEQQIYFKKHIAENPFTGYGLGSYMQDYSRNEEFKTAYESTFHYLVFILGIPMSIFFLGFYIFIFKKIKENINFSKNFRIGIIVGTISLLLSSYTNPYWLSSFDFCIPFAILIRLLQNDGTRKIIRNTNFV